jgi:transcriptional regulator with XRE-family HTH domain
MNAGSALRYARRRAGLTQRELAARAGVPQPAVARIERGTMSPRIATLERLLAATGDSLELVPRIGDGVDRSLIRAALEKSPQERITAAGAAGRNLAAFQRAVERGARG